MADEEKTTPSPTASLTEPEPAGTEPTSDEAPSGFSIGQLIVSIAGGVIGIGMFVVGVVLAVLHGIFSLWPLLLIAGSLVLYGFLLAWDRKQEQKSAAVRRTLHGYNVFLMSGLLLVVLGIVNVMVFTYGSEPIDMTSNGVHSLAPQTEQLLKSLNQKVKITVLYPEQSRDLLGQDYEYVLTQRMLQDSLLMYKEHSDKIEVKYVDPYRDPTVSRELIDKYPDLSLPAVLVEYGTGDPAEHEVLKHNDLVESPDPMAGTSTLKNKSEDAITSALKRLIEGKRATKIYFTAGNGELNPNDSTETSQRGIGVFSGRVKDLGMTVETFDPQAVAKVPDDADLVIVAGPQQPFSQAALQSMTDYLNRGGRMILMADLVTNPVTRSSVDLGLAGMLQPFNVALGNEPVYFLAFNLFSQSVEARLSGSAAPSDASLQLVTSLGGRTVPFYEARRVAPLRETPPAGPQGPPPEKYEVVTILEGGIPKSELGESKEVSTDILKRRTSLGVAVSERTGTPPPAMPGHPPLADQQKSEPRLVVLGDAEFAANAFLTQRGGSGGFTLLMSSVNWLRGRMELLGISPKEREPTHLEKTAKERWAMVWQPTALFMLFFVVTGITVWKVRHTA